ncbi:MAG: DUF1559 domain-containing protein, partial [Planctomycetales bacterium]|nr:DUF1559 domain-containing protein [Planctomycetales bacterium]
PVNAAREAARRIQCANNVRQIGLSLIMFHEAVQEFPKGVYSHPDENHADRENGLGWATKVLPYLEENGIYSMIANSQLPGYPDPWQPGVFRAAFQSRAPLPGGDHELSVFLCPSTSLPPVSPNLASGYPSYYSGYATASYKGSRGFCDRGILLRPDEANQEQRCWIDIQGRAVQFVKDPQRLATRLREVKDGTSKTILLGESAYYIDEEDWPLWIGSPARDEATLFKTEDVINCNISSPVFPLTPQDRARAVNDDCAFSWHPGGCQFVFVDNSVHFLSIELDLTTFRLLGDREDGVIMDEF